MNATLYTYHGIRYTYADLQAAYRQRQEETHKAIDSGDYQAACNVNYKDVREYLPQMTAPERAAPKRSGTTGHNQTLTDRRKSGIIKAIRRHLRRKIKMEVSKMDKVKIWGVCVNHVTWSKPQTLYFNSKDAAAECYNHFEYADKPQYIGAYNPQKVAAAIDTNPANVPPEVVLLYYRSYAEYIGDN